ncbi:MAG: acetaldehyde dehydrogenase (acetylating) [Desulfobacteraceae bacterium]|nr:acetaldehyde dehydrogenase (acetylating) [Desulfobacteraceae bacterium]
MAKLSVAILGSGNIGSDLMYKVRRSDKLQLEMVAGIDPSSDGLARARKLGYETCTDGIEGILRNKKVQLVFDATSAKSHLAHAPRLKEAGIIAVDLTPAAVGPGVIPVVNLKERMNEPNVNLVSCGAQATVPVVAAINKVTPVKYAETVSTIASLSAGPGTRHNIDEFTRTTARAVHNIGGAQTSKSIIVLNPADPPIIMRNTVYAVVEPPVDEKAIRESVLATAEKIKSYVPGYTITVEPFLDGDHITTCLEVTGAGDYLATYAGNLDIITAAAINVAECYADNLDGKDGK